MHLICESPKFQPIRTLVESIKPNNIERIEPSRIKLLQIFQFALNLNTPGSKKDSESLY